MRKISLIFLYFCQCVSPVQLNSEKATFANKKQSIERALNGLRMQEMKTKQYEEFLKQMNNAERGRD